MTTTLARRRRPRSRSGFTLLETVVVIMLLSLLALLLSTAWGGMSRVVTGIAADSRVAAEAKLATASLTRDLGGSLPDDHTGDRPRYRVVGRMIVAGPQLWICFDGGTTPNGAADWGSPDVVVSYDLQSGSLTRWNQSSSDVFTVARNLNAWSVTDLGDGVRIDLTFVYRTLTRTYTLIAKDP